MQKRLFSVLLAFALIIAGIPMTTAMADPPLTDLKDVSGTTLTDGATYAISNEAGLVKLAALVNGGEDCSGNFFVLMNNITISGDHNSDSAANWTPIGNGTTSFNGSFYGEDHLIDNIKLHGGTYSGLFGAVDTSGKVLDLGVGSTGSTFNSATYAGGVAGVNNGLIQNCYNSVTFSDNSSTINGCKIGGIAGENNGTIQNCLNQASLSRTDEHDFSLGGIAGESRGSVINCRNDGNVTGYIGVGGIVGYTVHAGDPVPVIINCLNTGTITGSSNCGGIAGGLDTNTLLENCYNNGTITASDGKYYGPVVGDAGTYCTMKFFYWKGTSQIGWGSLGLGTTISDFKNVADDTTGQNCLTYGIKNSNEKRPLRAWGISGSNIIFSNTVVTSDPANASVKVGSTADFTAFAAGDAMSYQWQVSSDGGAHWANVIDGSGSKTPTYTTPAATAGMGGYQYRCYLNNVYSDPATLSVTEAPKINGQPKDVTADAGTKASFTADASGYPAPGYKWQSSADGSTWNDVQNDTVYSGADTKTLSVKTSSGLNGYKYRCIASNTEGSATSDAVTLTVNKPVYTISAVSGNASYGSVSGGGLYKEGDTATLHAVPNPGCHFVRWTEGSSEVSTSADYSFTVAGARNLLAVFEQDASNPSTGVTPVGLSCTETDVTLYGSSNGSITITASGGNSGKYEYSVGGNWQSSNVFDGLAAGDYTASVRDAANTGNTAACGVTVGQPKLLGSVAAKKLPSKAKTGTALTIIPPGAPKGYTANSVSFSSSDPSVAAVDSDGNLTFLAGGKATITTKVVAQTTDKKGKIKTKTTTVKRKVAVIQPVSAISLSQTDVTIARKQKVKLTADISPSTTSSKKLKWTSSNNKVATVSSSGVVTAKAGGTVVITCTATDGSGVSASCTVTVS